MKWPAYPDYKSSRLPWIGDIPTHWRIAPNRALLELRRQPVGKKSGDYPLLSLTLRGVILRDVSENKGKFPAEFDTYQAVDPGNLVFCLFDIEETPRTVGLAQNRGMVTGAYDVFRVRSGVDGRYVEYLYLALDHRKSLSYFYSGLRKVIRMPTFKSIRTPVPPLPEQVAIANFLDIETARIDALIGKQEQLIRTLREDRAATITHAVTRGLDPNAHLKYSGNKWIGSIPNDWDAVPMKRVATRITDGAHVSPDTQGGMYDFVSTRDVTDRGIDFAGSLKTTPASYEYLVRNGCKPEVGDLLFSKDGTVGRTVVVTEAREFVVASSLIIIKCDSEVMSPWFAHYACQSTTTKQQVDSYVKGAGLPRLSISNLRKTVVTRPPIKDQLQIVDFLDGRCSKIDTLISKAPRVIDTLREYRSALITGAVTGKIDVRRAA
jgi:type I restriction enzyme, S subunit